MATVTHKLTNLSTNWQVPDDPTIIADLVKTSGILQTAEVGKSTHGNKHRFKFFSSLPAAVFRAIGEGIAPAKVSDDHAEIDLWPCEVSCQVDHQEAKSFPGGKNGYIANYSPAYLQGIGQAWAKQMIYGGTPLAASTSGFKGFHTYAKENGNVVAQKGGASGARTSIIAVNWDLNSGASVRIPGIDGSELVSITDMTPANPVPIVVDTATNKQLDCFKWLFSAMNALVIPAKKACAVITQIDATHDVTVADMNKLVDAIYNTSGRKVIYCNLDGYNSICKLKDTKLNLFTESNNYDDQLGFWRGVPIVIDENILSTETSAID